MTEVPIYTAVVKELGSDPVRRRKTVHAQYAPDGYRYGVRFTDGSVMSQWNGSTQRQRAEEMLTELLNEYADGRGAYRLVRHRPGCDWEEVPRLELVDDVV